MIKQILRSLVLITFIVLSNFGTKVYAQIIDTLAIQDFEITPSSPTWNFTGPVIYNSGFSSATSSPPNSPIGIGGSRAWETTTNSGGLVLDFDNITIPVGYDSVRVHFNLAAMNLVSSGGGPDNLDYVLVAYSTDGGTIFNNRLRIRGAVNDNSFWAYDATGVAQVYYLPATEALFQPVNTGLATTMGYSNCEIVFPGNIGQVKMKITGRSSSSTDTWFIDNLLITGEILCSPSASTIIATACDTFVSPSGNYAWTSSGTYNDTIVNAGGCDSVITFNLSINNSTTSTFTATSCDSYTSDNGNTYTASGIYTETIPNSAGCDSIITLNLTINQSTGSTLTATACESFMAPSGIQYISSGVYNDTIPNSIGCDSIITINLTVYAATTDTITETVCNSYTSPSGSIYTVSGTYNDTISNVNGCDSIITINLTVNNSTTFFMIEGSCGPYTSPSGQVYTTSGIYNDTLTNSAGCDSIITINLTIGTATAATISETACNSYTTPSGMVLAASGIYNDTIANTFGCDSIITINLTVNNSTTSSIMASTCGNYTSPAGNVYTASGNYIDTIANSNGCDSIISIALTVTNIDLTVATNAATLTAGEVNATYQWIDCNTNQAVPNAINQAFTATVNGSYAAIITKNNCTDTTACVNVTGIGINDVTGNEIQLSIYPNPNTGVFSMVTNVAGSFTVSNELGAVVKTLELNNANNFSVKIDNLPAGVYFISGRNSTGIITKKVIVNQ